MVPEITMSDCDAATFREFLTWIYTGACSAPLSRMRIADLWSLLELSVHCRLDSLALACEDTLAATLTTKTCCALWLLADDIGDARLAARCADFFAAHVDAITQSRFWDGRVLALINRSRADSTRAAAAAAAPPVVVVAAVPPAVEAPQPRPRFDDRIDLFVPPPPPLPVPVVESPRDSDSFATDTNLSLGDRRRSAELRLPSTDADDLFELFDQAQLTVADVSLFPGAPGTTPFDALPSAFASLGHTLGVNTLRTGQDIADRTPLLQGEVWWHTVDQLRVMIETLRVAVEGDLCTLFLYDDSSDELYARIVTRDNRECEIAMPAALGLVGAAFATRSTVNAASAYDDPRFYRGIDEQLGSRTRALIAVPIVTKLSERPIGVIEILNSDSTRAFSGACQAQVEFVARMAASLVEMAAERVKATVASHIESINSHIDARQAATTTSATGSNDGSHSSSSTAAHGTKRAATSPTPAAPAQPRHERVFAMSAPELPRSRAKSSDPRRFASDANVPFRISAADLFLKSGPLAMFERGQMFPEPAAAGGSALHRKKRMRPSTPILHLRLPPAHSITT